MQRYQIYLDDDQRGDLVALAAREGVSVSAVIRRALDRELASPPAPDALSRFRAAVRDTAGIAPYLPDGLTYTDLIRRAERAKRRPASR